MSYIGNTIPNKSNRALPQLFTNYFWGRLFSFANFSIFVSRLSVRLTDINTNLTDVMDKTSNFTVHGWKTNPNSGVITIGDALAVTLDYAPLTKISASFTLSSTRGAGEALFAFDGVSPTHMSCGGSIYNSSDEVVGRCLLGVNNPTDSYGNKYLITLTTLPAGSYNIDFTNMTL